MPSTLDIATSALLKWIPLPVNTPIYSNIINLIVAGIKAYTVLAFLVLI
jgi:hypothetical protein